jgi:hypothetical protein
MSGDSDREPEPLPKHPGGRPTVWTPETELRLFEAIRLGISLKNSAAYAGIGEQTVYDRMRNDAEFSGSVQRARATAVATVAIEASRTEHPVRLKYCHRYLAIHDNQIEPQKIEHSGGIAVTLADFFDQGAQELDNDESDQKSEGEAPPA